LINAGKQLVTLRPGGAIFHHADSFSMIRGGHIDLCILGAFQVSERGDLANWATSENDAAPAIGGAMDLAAGAKRVWVLMDHVTKDGKPKIMRSCSYPLTAPSNLAVIDVTTAGLVVIELVAGLNFEQLQSATEAPLLWRPSSRPQ
jgi:3-oxoadipate CoA-transferase, beta subunit